MNDASPGRMTKMAVPPPSEAVTAVANRHGGSVAPALLEFSVTGIRIIEAGLLALIGMLLITPMAGDVDADGMALYFNTVLIAVIFYAVIAEMIGGYDVDTRFSVMQAWSRILTAWLATALFMITLGFLFKSSEFFSRGWAVTWFAGGATAICLVRAAATIWMLRLKRRGVFNQRVAIFGAATQGRRLAAYIAGNERLTVDLVGFFDDREPARIDGSPGSMPILGDIDALIARIRAGQIDQVIIALPWSAEKRLQHIVAALAITPVRIRLAPDLASFAFAQRPVVMLGDMPMMTLFERPISGTDQIFKKFEDMILGSLITFALLPLFAIVAVAIRLDSPGPVIFRQRREGFNNQTFEIFKFRSMRTERCEEDGITQARRDDDRITAVGRFIRRTSIDELPQLFNVLRGEMSLVGPRPHAPSTRAGDKLFGDVVATYAARHKVKPGMTGWAQIKGWRGETDTEEKLLRRLEHDLYYIENWSVSLDLYILIRTVWAIFSTKQAY